VIRHTRTDCTSWKKVGGLLAALLTVALAGCSGQGENANRTAATNTAATNANVSVSEGSFKEAAMTWGHVEEARARLDKIVEANDFGNVHEAVFKVRDSVNELPSQSTALPADKQEKLASQVKQVGRLAAMLDEAGASEDTNGVHEHHMAINEALDTMKGVYPAGVMPARAHTGDKNMPGMDPDKPGMGDDMDDGMSGGIPAGNDNSAMNKAKKKMGDKKMPKKKDGMKMPDMDHH
jgi:hypothetical protein